MRRRSLQSGWTRMLRRRAARYSCTHPTTRPCVTTHRQVGRNGITRKELRCGRAATPAFGPAEAQRLRLLGQRAGQSGPAPHPVLRNGRWPGTCRAPMLGCLIGRTRGEPANIKIA